MLVYSKGSGIGEVWYIIPCVVPASDIVLPGGLDA